MEGAWSPQRVRYYPSKTAAPGVTDDLNKGYRVSDVWIDEINDAIYACVGSSAGAAVWLDLGQAGGGTDVTLAASATALLDLTGQELGLDTQAANIVFSGPTTGAAAVPTFRGLVAADIPDLSGSYESTGAVTTHAALTTGVHGVGAGTVAEIADIAVDANLSAAAQAAITASHAAVTLTASAAVLLDLTGQDLSLDTQTANLIFGGPAAGGAAVPTFRSLAAADIPDLSGTYQPLDSTLTSLAVLGTAADKIAYTTGIDTWAESALTAFGRSILDDDSEATFKATVNLEIGTDVQAYSAALTPTKTAPAITAGDIPIDCSAGTSFAVSLNADVTTFTLSNIPASGTTYAFLLEFTADGTPRSVTWSFSSVTVDWAGGTPPTMTSTNGKRDTFIFYVHDGGTTWNGAIFAQDL